MGFTNSEQLREMFLSGGMGFLLGAYYDVFRILRRLLHPSRVAVFFQDCLFFVTSAVAVFLFSLALTDGVVRAYTVLMVLVGCMAYRYTVGRLVLHTVCRGVALGGRMCRWVQRVLMVPFGWLQGKGKSVWTTVKKFIRHIAKKSVLFFKKGLQLQR